MPVLEVRDLQFNAPGSATPTVRVDRLALDAGERLVLRGPSGCGKTSLLRCIVGLERASGTVEFQGKPIADADYPRFRSQCCYLSQRPVGTRSTVGQDLAFARTLAQHYGRAGALEQREQRALLGQLGMASVPWDRAFDRLSVGEQQRVALVRTLTLAPSILLLDEPTASLDSQRELDVEHLVLRHLDQAPERALIWVSHHPQQVERMATRVYELTRPTPGGGS